MMIKHFYLLYFNFIKWQERTKFLNNERKTIVAEYYTMLIIMLWFLFLYFLSWRIFNFNIDFLENVGKIKAMLIISIPIVLLRFLVLRIFNRTLINYEDDFNKIRNWKNSKYRKQAFVFTIFYFVFFIPLTILILVV